MCGGMSFYKNKNEFIKIYYPQPYPKIEVFKKDLSKIQCIWGRRNEKSLKVLKYR